MAKDIGKLAEVGEKHLLIGIDACVSEIFAAFLPPISPVSFLNLVFDGYKSKRDELIDCGLDTKEYDDRVRELTKNHPKYKL